MGQVMLLTSVHVANFVLAEKLNYHKTALNLESDICGACNGLGLTSLALEVSYRELSIVEFYQQTISETLRVLTNGQSAAERLIVSVLAEAHSMVLLS